jgi:hypothetical protein
MKKFTTLCWVVCLLIAIAGGLFGCDRAQKKDGENSREITAQGQSAPDQDQPEIDPTLKLIKKPFNPRAGRIPTTKQDYDSALVSVKRYKARRRNNHVHNNYFSRELAEKILLNKECVGLRVYRADSAGRGNGNYLRIVVIGVDKNGRDISTPVNLVDSIGAKSQERFLFGISDEKCPDNCEGCALYQ